jgi:hypothetical protein
LTVELNWLVTAAKMPDQRYGYRVYTCQQHEEMGDGRILFQFHCVACSLHCYTVANLEFRYILPFPVPVSRKQNI